MQSFIIYIYADCGIVRGCNHVLHCLCHSVRFYSCFQDESAVSSYSLPSKWGKKWYSSSLSFVLIWIVFVLRQSSPRMISAVTGFVSCVWVGASKILAGHCTFITFRVDLIHGIMGRKLTDGGLLRYRKWVPNNWEMLSNKGVGTADQWECGTATQQPITWTYYICCPGVVGRSAFAVQACSNLWDLI